MKRIALLLLSLCGLSLAFTGAYSPTNFPNGVNAGTLNATNGLTVGTTFVSTIGDGYATINGPLTATNLSTSGTLTANKLVVGTTVNAVGGYFSGNVGIGTTAPGSKLSILDASDTLAGQRIQLGKVSGATDYTMGRNPTTGFLDIFSTENGYGGLRFNTITGGVPSDKLAILNNGNIGVGQPTPSTKLEVNGTVSANWVRSQRNEFYFNSNSNPSTNTTTVNIPLSQFFMTGSWSGLVMDLATTYGNSASGTISGQGYKVNRVFIRGLSNANVSVLDNTIVSTVGATCNVNVVANVNATSVDVGFSHGLGGTVFMGLNARINYSAAWTY